MIRFFLYLIIFWIAYEVVKRLIGFLASSSEHKNQNSIHTENTRRNKTEYKNVEDAEFTEIKSQDNKKKNS
jgi:hypothetical protein